MDLFTCSSDCGRRCNDFWPHPCAIKAPFAQLIDSGLIQPHHRPKGSADQVELVLNDQVRWPKSIQGYRFDRRQTTFLRVLSRFTRFGIEEPMPEAPPSDSPEQGRDLALPRHLGKLVNGPA